jgi:hypothetical protein
MGPILALVASLLVAPFSGPASAVVAAPQSDPSARLQVIVKEVYIYDDREGIFSGEGEMQFYVGVWRCNEGVPPPCRGYLNDSVAQNLPNDIRGLAEPLVRAGILFNASTHDTVTVNRPMPQAGDVMWGRGTTPELGFPVIAGEHYVLRFEMLEWDDGEGEGNNDEFMGYVEQFLDLDEHGLGLGTHDVVSRVGDGTHGGDYRVTYEVRRAPVPDLNVGGISVLDLPGSTKKLVCMGITNVELSDAGPFVAVLRVDGVVPPGGRATAGGLAAASGGDLCVEVELPTSGQHTLSVSVDDEGQVTEYNETNNVYEDRYVGTGPASVSTPPPSAALPDLTVSAIKVNGRVPDGKDDCTAGKNSVTVAVKNEGTHGAGDFVVRLGVDETVRDEMVNGLEAGQEREIRFDNVRLKQGDHTLSVTVDGKEEAKESNEGNNTLKVTARCSDDH